MNEEREEAEETVSKASKGSRGKRDGRRRCSRHAYVGCASDSDVRKQLYKFLEEDEAEVDRKSRSLSVQLNSSF